MAPVLNVPADQTIECNTTPNWGTATATDNCDANVTITFADETSTVNCCTSRITRTWTATDDCGNAVSATTVITIVDTTPPVITNVPATTTVECNGGPLVWPTISATDNCSAVTITFQDITTQNGCCTGRYSVTRVWIVSDLCGNTASASATINVVDNTPPTITCAPDKTIGCNDEVTFDAPTVTDNCGSPALIVVSTTSSFNALTGVTTYTRVWRAEDPCANLSVTCTQNVYKPTCDVPQAHCTMT